MGFLWQLEAVILLHSILLEVLGNLHPFRTSFNPNWWEIVLKYPSSLAPQIGSHRDAHSTLGPKAQSSNFPHNPLLLLCCYYIIMLLNLSPHPVSLSLSATSVSWGHLLFKPLTPELLFQGLLVWGRVWGTQTKILLHVLIYICYFFSYIFLMAESGEELKSRLVKVKGESEKPGLKVNIQKTKIIAISPIASWEIGKQWKQWQILFSWAPKITADSDCSYKIKRHFLLGRKAVTNLDSILKSRAITLPTKWKLLK